MAPAAWPCILSLGMSTALPIPRPTPWRLLVLVIVLAAGLPVRGQSYPAAGDRSQLWLLRPDEGGITSIYLWSDAGPANQIAKVRSQRGQLTPGGLAAGDGQLWMIYDQGLIQSLTPNQDPSGLTSFTARLEGSMPRGAILQAAAANDRGLWLLVRAETPAARTAIHDAVAGIIPPTQPEPAAGSTPASQPAATDQTQPAERDYLLHLDRRQWTLQPLPPDWPQGAPAWVVLAGPRQDLPVLAAWPKPGAESPDTPGNILRIYRPRTEGESGPAWTSQNYPLAGHGALKLTVVEGQIILGQRVDVADGLGLDLAILRPEGASDIGRLVVKGVPAASAWTLTTAGTTAALVVAPGGNRVLWSRMDVRGHSVANSVALTARTGDLVSQWTDQLILMSVLAVATLIMFVFWRREGMGPRLDLPRSLVLAELLPRTLAGLVDLAPCIIIGSLLWGADPRQVLADWPGWAARLGGLGTLIPVALIILLIFVYTSLLEMFTGRTLGKMMLGLRVTNYQGGPPHLWQVLARNAGRILELIAPPLLILPAISPYRQRLGDMMAKTVVVQSSHRGKDQGNQKDEGAGHDD